MRTRIEISHEAMSRETQVMAMNLVHVLLRVPNLAISFIAVAKLQFVIMLPLGMKNRADRKLQRVSKISRILPRKPPRGFSDASLVQNHRLCHWILYQGSFSSLKP